MPEFRQFHHRGPVGPALALVLALGLGMAACSPNSKSTPAPSPAPAAPPLDLKAENLTTNCVLDASPGIREELWRIGDDLLDTSKTLEAGEWVSLAWDKNVPVKTIWLAFRDYPQAYRVRQFDADGALVREETGPEFVNHAVFVEPKTRSVTVLADRESDLAALYAFGEGAVPNYHPWKSTPEKLDYLVIAMHPDDDVLFMGAIIPLYTVEQGREGAIFYTATLDRVRKDEAQNGAWAMGLRTAPILGTFPDIKYPHLEEPDSLFAFDRLVLHLVKLLRQYRPEVVFSHDLNGEYGHWQHKRLAHAVQQAVPLAADGSFDSDSVGQFGAWQVKKLYLHLYGENKIALPVGKPIPALDGKTPVEIARTAFKCHRSQRKSRHKVRNEGAYSMSDFGLAYTVVGLDTPDLNDPFEHIDPATIHGAGPPPSSPTTVTDNPVP